MLNNRFVAGVLGMLLALSLCACAETQVAPQTQETEETQQENTQKGTQETEAELVMPAEYDALLRAVVESFPNVSGLADYPELSGMYDGHASLVDLGYALADMDGDGNPELLLKSMESPFIYDAFTLADGQLADLFTGDEHTSYRLYEDGYVEKQWQENENIRGTDYFRIENNTLVLFDRVVMDAEHALQLGLIDSLEGADTNLCFFRSSTKNKEDYQSLSAQEALKLQQSFVEDNFHLLPSFTALSAYGG